MADKIYVGNGVEKFDGDVVDFSINLTKIKDEASEFIFEYNGQKYIKLKQSKKRSVDNWGKTHSVEVNTYTPTKEPEAEVEKAVDEDLPF